MQEFQVYAFDVAGQVVHAGPFRARVLTLATVRGNERRWRSWRRRYLAENPGDYPLRRAGVVVRVDASPVGEPERRQTFNL